MSTYRFFHKESTEEEYLIKVGWLTMLETFYAEVSLSKTPYNFLIEIGEADRRFYSDIERFQSDLAADLRKNGITKFAFTEEQIQRLLLDKYGFHEDSTIAKLMGIGIDKQLYAHLIDKYNLYETVQIFEAYGIKCL